MLVLRLRQRKQLVDRLWEGLASRLVLVVVLHRISNMRSYPDCQMFLLPRRHR